MTTVIPFRPRAKPSAPPEGDVPEHRRHHGTPFEKAQCAVVNRVSAAIHMRGADGAPGYPTWDEWVDAAYLNVDTNPEMLVSVSDTIATAHAVIAAMAPVMPDWDEAIFQEIGGDPGQLRAAVEDWVKAVLG